MVEIGVLHFFDLVMYSAIGCLDRKYLENNSWEGLLRSQLLRNYHIFTLYEQKWDNLT